jgi:hypothetical protein
MPKLEGFIAQLRRFAARARALRYALHAAVAAAGWAVAVLILSRVVPLEATEKIAAAGLPVPFVAAGLAWVINRPKPSVLARIADIRLDLKERLSTAWERRSLSAPLDDWQRRDALEHASGRSMASAFPLRLHRGEASLAAALALFAIGLLVVPNPMDQVLAKRRADQVSQARAAATLQRAKEQAAAQPKSSAVDAQIEKILKDAQARIQKAPSPRKALEAISPAEDQLARIPDPGTPGLASSAQNLASALSGTSAGQAAAQAISKSPAQGAQALKNLGSQLKNLTTAQKDQLAKALAQASAQAHSPQMSSSLKNAAQALQAGDNSAAQQALGDVASQLQSLDQAQQNDQAVASAISSLEAARAELAQQADRDAGHATGANPAASGSPSAAASGSGTGNGAGNGNGTSTGTGNGNGNGSGNGNGGGGATGTGSHGSGTGSGTGAQATEKIFVPAPLVPGQSEDQPTPLGPGQDVPLSPYSQVITAYQKAALDVIDRSLVPGSEKDLVREYFSSLGDLGAGP